MGLFNKLWPKKSNVGFDLYTDGSQKGGWGSWAYVVVQRGVVVSESSARERNASSLRMEIQAAIEGLRFLAEGSKITLFSDCRILLDAMTCKGARSIQSNVDQLEVLHQLRNARMVQWHWVRAHAGDTFNERCDQLCVLARSTSLRKALNGS